jgi:hypothetical protein
MAKRIVKVFGKETLELIERETEKLAGVHSIGEKWISLRSS